MSTSQAPAPPQYTPRSNLHIFTSTLHLLNLPSHPTWPTITIATFSPASTLQTRIKATEWSLYHLFHLYCHYAPSQASPPHSTSETTSIMSTLTPTFTFPPSTPLQSLTLRSGFYKVLTELKRIGVLPRAILLRKTMFDECKGERFEEVMAAFAMVVLRSVVGWSKPFSSSSVSASISISIPASESSSTRGTAKPDPRIANTRPNAKKHAPSTSVTISSKEAKSIRDLEREKAKEKASASSQSTTHIDISTSLAQRLTTLPTPKPTAPEHLIPLLIAHRVSLQNKLLHRQQLAAQASAESARLAKWEQNIQDRLSALQSSRLGQRDGEGEDNIGGEAISNEDVSNLRDNLARVFATNPAWVAYLLEGRPSLISSFLLSQASPEQDGQHESSLTQRESREENTTATFAEHSLSRSNALLSSKISSSPNNPPISTTTTSSNVQEPDADNHSLDHDHSPPQTQTHIHASNPMSNLQAQIISQNRRIHEFQKTFIQQQQQQHKINNAAFRPNLTSTPNTATRLPDGNSKSAPAPAPATDLDVSRILQPTDTIMTSTTTNASNTPPPTTSTTTTHMPPRFSRHQHLRLATATV